MTKTQLIEELAKRTGMNKSGVERYMGGLIGLTRELLARGEEVPFTGLGKFRVVQAAARLGTNPQDGTPLNIPAQKKVKFKAHKALKEALAA